MHGRWRGVGVVGGVALSLACGGLAGDFGREAALDAGDEAERARLAGDFAGAEAILQRRLQADPSDARSWRLLGDVNLTRGQRFTERWKENLGWALDAYEEAVRREPTSCLIWGRIAAVVVGASENEAIAIPAARIEALPLDRGWASCAGPAMLSLVHQRLPTAAALASANVPPDASEADRMAKAAPWLVEAVARTELSIAWEPLLSPPEPTAQAPFVVLEVPTTGASVGGSAPRRFTHPEWQLVSRVAGDRLVYLDRRFAAQVPEEALTRAPGCPGTEWTLQGEDRVPVGTCTAGPHDRRASDLYDADILRPTGVAHFHEPSIDRARISWATVADKPVRCLGGPVGRQFYDTPSCRVAYDRAVPVTRSIPKAAGIVAQSEAHAELAVRAARSEALFGPEVAGHLARSEAGVGMPYALYTWAQPDLTGCRGRGVFTKLRIVDGGLEFECNAQERVVRFRELALVEIAPAQ
jgi:hypothetical protein